MTELRRNSPETTQLHELVAGKAELLFHFGGHKLESDAIPFRPFLDQTDVYAPENACGTDDDTKHLSQLAKGDYKTYQRLRETTDVPFFLAIYDFLMTQRPGRKLEVINLDVPNTAYWRDAVKLIVRYTQTVPIRETVDASFDQFASNFRELARIQEERDDIIAQNIIDYLLNRDSEGNWPADRPLKILFSFGANHRHILEKLQTAGLSVLTTPDSLIDSDELPYTEGLIATYQKGEQPSKELLAKAYITMALSIAANIQLESVNEAFKVWRTIVDKIEPPDLEIACAHILQVTHQDGSSGLGPAVGDLLKVTTGFRSIDRNEVKKLLQE
jgi:hypothetical protein